MTQTPIEQEPSYIFTNGGIAQNPALQNLCTDFQLIATRHEKAQSTYAGAKIIQILRESPWISSVVLKLEPESRYDDSGGDYRSIKFRFTEITMVAGALPPGDAEFGEGEEFDQAKAIEFLCDEWVSSDELDTDGFYNCFNSEYCYDSLTLEIDRTRVEHLLDKDTVDGHEAFRLMFPNHISRLAPVNPNKPQIPTPVASRPEAISDISSTSKSVAVFVVAEDSNGEPVMLVNIITLTDQSFDNGDHYDIAKAAADAQGYVSKIAFDEFDPAGKTIDISACIAVDELEDLPSATPAVSA